MFEIDNINIYRFIDNDGSTVFGYDIGDTEYITALGLVEAFKHALHEDTIYTDNLDE